MPFEVIKKLDQEIWLKISDQLTVEDYEQTQSLILLGLEWFEDSRILVILENFNGWSKDERWDDILFMQEHDDKITKIAIVGDEKWKDDAFMFSGKSFRSTEIEFFSEENLDLAKQWLAQEN